MVKLKFEMDFAIEKNSKASIENIIHQLNMMNYYGFFLSYICLA